MVPILSTSSRQEDVYKRQTVRKALKYIINTELAVRIREEAIKHYAGAESIIKIRV